MHRLIFTRNPWNWFYFSSEPIVFGIIGGGFVFILFPQGRRTMSSAQFHRYTTYTETLGF